MLSVCSLSSHGSRERRDDEGGMRHVSGKLPMYDTGRFEGCTRKRKGSNITCQRHTGRRGEEHAGTRQASAEPHEAQERLSRRAKRCCISAARSRERHEVQEQKAPNRREADFHTGGQRAPNYLLCPCDEEGCGKRRCNICKCRSTMHPCRACGTYVCVEHMHRGPVFADGNEEWITCTLLQCLQAARVPMHETPPSILERLFAHLACAEQPQTEERRLAEFVQRMGLMQATSSIHIHLRDIMSARAGAEHRIQRERHRNQCERQPLQRTTILRRERNNRPVHEHCC